ncbi:ATP-binding protein [Aquimarina sp. 2-A2]|uniref:ATP-binding protein n=1 Tax=Aquimarina sp. 2-A2 TaxID=3382644 RepID=UPI00387F121B
MTNSQENSITRKQDKNSSENSICLPKIIFDNLGDPVVLLDEQLRVLESNQAFLALSDKPSENILNKSFFGIDNKKWDHKKIKLLLNSILHETPSTNVPITLEIAHKHYEISAKKLSFTEELSSDRILVSLKDITSSITLERKLQEQISNYDQLIYLSPYLIAILQGEKLIIEIANDTILENWGKGKNIIGKPLLEVLPEIRKQGFEDLLLQVLATGKAYHAFEVPAEHFKEGKMVKDYYDFAYQPIFSLNGKVEKVAVIATNVSKQTELYHKISESEKKFRQMIDLLPDKIISANPTGEIIYYNKSWQEYTGLSLKKLQNKGWTKIIHPDDKEEFFKKLNVAYATGEGQEMELRFLNKSGKYKWHLYRAVAIHDETGNIKTWLSTCTEIHRVKEEQRRKEEFLKMVSHELKTPVTSIKGYVQLLLSMINANQEFPEALVPVQRSLKRIDSQVSRLTRLISEMLDLSRVENSKLELKKTHFSLNELIYETVEDIRFSSDLSEVEFHDSFEMEVLADRDRVGQVLINLITNAIKYAPKSQLIEIAIYKKDENYGAISVKDYGIGIPKKDLSKIFDRFYRVEGENEETFSGFGIGLFLVKEIIDRHGGTIDVESKKGKGSKFTFTLPLINFNKNN